MERNMAEAVRLAEVRRRSRLERPRSLDSGTVGIYLPPASAPQEREACAAAGAPDETAPARGAPHSMTLGPLGR